MRLGNVEHVRFGNVEFGDVALGNVELFGSVVVMNPPLPVPEPLMLLLVAYLTWFLELD